MTFFDVVNKCSVEIPDSEVRKTTVVDKRGVTRYMAVGKIGERRVCKMMGPSGYEALEVPEEVKP